MRFDFTCVGIGTIAFIELPQNSTYAAASGWVKKTRADDPVGLESLELMCPETDRVVCLFFDDTGYVAGLQIAVSTFTFFLIRKMNILMLHASDVVSVIACVKKFQNKCH